MVHAPRLPRPSFWKHVPVSWRAHYRYRLAQLQMSLFQDCRQQTNTAIIQHPDRGTRNEIPETKKVYIPFDKFLACSHLLEERRISDNPSCVLDFTACLIQTSNNADDCTLHDVRQIRYPIEWHTACPLVDDLDHSKAGLADEVIRVIRRQDDLMFSLNLVDLFWNLDNFGHAAFQARCQSGLHVGLFLKDKRREQCDDLLGLILGEYVFQNKFRKDQLVCRVDLDAVRTWLESNETDEGHTSQATLPFSSTREPSSTKPRSLRTWIRCS